MSQHKGFVLSTDRLILRHLQDEDADFIIQLVNSKGWLQYIGDRNIRDHHAALKYINSLVDQYESNPLALSCIIKKSDSSPIGLCGLLKRDFLPHQDIGYALIPEAYGQGLAFEITSALIGRYFEQKGHTLLHALIKPDNQASINLILKLGFKRDTSIQVPSSHGQLYSFRNI